jgi:hypothetical protein
VTAVAGYGTGSALYWSWGTDPLNVTCVVTLANESLAAASRPGSAGSCGLTFTSEGDWPNIFQPWVAVRLSST